MIYGMHRDLIGIYLGDSPKWYKRFFDEIIRRAVNLIGIEPESASILNEKRYAVEGMLLSLFPEFSISGEDDNGEPIYFEPEDDESISFARKLYLNISSLELDSGDTFSWSQYFGLLALMEIDHYMLQIEWMIEEIVPPPDWPDWEQNIADSRITALLNSCEAVCFGEALVEENHPVKAIIRDKISKQAQQAVLKRHQPLRNLKNAFINFYLKAPDKSNKSNIARKFYRSLSDEEQKIICQSQEIHKAVRTLLNHLNKVTNKQKGPYSFL